MSVITLRRALEGHTTLHIARTLSDYEQLVSLLYPWMLPQTLPSSIISFCFFGFGTRSSTATSAG
jgi:hypothetical protein